ncbi:MAG: ATP-binding protein, partial [Pseudomonadota bacterium]
MSFRLKTVLGIACIEALLLTILVISGLNYLSSSNADQLQQRAATTAKLVATMTGDAVIAVDLATLDVLVEQALRNPDLVYLRIRSANGTVLSEGGTAEALAASFVQDETVAQARSDQRLDVSAPITVAGSEFGQVEIGLSTATLDSIFGDALVWMVGIALSEMVLVALLGLALGHYLTRQLMMLKRGAKQVASGDFGYQIPIDGRDELAETADSFNSMSTALARYAEMAEDARRKAEAGRELAESTLKDALDSMRDHVLVIDDEGRVVLANRSYRRLYCQGAYPECAENAFAAEAERNEGQTKDYVEARLEKLATPLTAPRWEAKLTDGRHLLIAQQPMSTGGAVIVQTDVSELYQALEENRLLQQELIQRKKSEAIGTLAGGLAHEINTPVQVIADNATFVAETIGEIIQMVDQLSEDDIDRDGLSKRLEAIDWAFVKDEIPQALADMADGTGRVRDLIQTFKQLAKPDGTAISLVELDDVVQSAIDDTRNSWTSIAEIRTDVPDDMPLVPCQTDQIRQVLRHLIVNAAHAIEDRGAGEPGLISIRMSCHQDHARIEVEDNGCGIPQSDLDCIYDVLFTTKEPGRGSGEGLALTHMYVTRGHGGHIRVESVTGEGTRFTVDLPLANPRSAEIGDEQKQLQEEDV